MENCIPHDLHDFMRQISAEIAAEYNRIRKRSGEDPGTAGDQGEENWAEVLRDWLPPSFPVVTKGRIIGADGRSSPQVDVIVLKDIYPQKLLNKKHYLAGGVAAAFECKTTLKGAHIEAAVKTSRQIKRLCPVRYGSPYGELHAPILYGLLAHSHSWSSPGSQPEHNISSKLRESDNTYIPHPRESLDLLCVADLGMWALNKISFLTTTGMNSSLRAKYGEPGSSTSFYIKHRIVPENEAIDFTPVGSLIAYLTRRLAWENPPLRQLAEYYQATNLEGGGSGSQRLWPSCIFSKHIRSQVECGRLSNSKWDEWSLLFP